MVGQCKSHSVYKVSEYLADFVSPTPSVLHLIVSTPRQLEVASMSMQSDSPLTPLSTSSCGATGNRTSNALSQMFETSPTRTTTPKKSRGEGAVLKLLLTQSAVLLSFDGERKGLVPVER